ncbi:ABC transporter ATP-binding protein [Saliterribacillus persicus]|uniref:Peptide/nickel transport system ATP-binding protein/oligopeptide transport system ATP-binding protein n=1 Tax=Saliterribacillus persicus TaxID=930114 RepID=A0A368YDA7_9BACI|nr:dipeptide ABC transporter ATP-binding protein [Saliterribacillus persicus]RCW76857.1 peptide/nickel transport system ATP-binding protein/oligopeptide transport system ATP-binding protein [Saliterribacillus persicus]
MTEMNTETTSKPLLEVRNLKKYFPVRGAFGRLGKTLAEVKAVDDISFNLYKGETYGLVGESGCGKSTAGRSILHLTEPTSGHVFYNDKDIFSLSDNEMRKLRTELQMVFQDPFSSLNPRKRIGDILEEPLAIHDRGSKAERRNLVLEMLEKVGMQREHYYRYPHEFSGGQRQRIGIARALILNPNVLILDEPVSALDVSIQSQMLNLLKDLQKEYQLTYLFIAHDMSVVRHISDRIGVMYLGHLVEEANTDQLFDSPLHPYTEALLSAVPVADNKKKKDRIVIKGEVPSPMDPPSGCVFHTRCPYVMDICKTVTPKKREKDEGHFVACHLYEE